MLLSVVTILILGSALFALCFPGKAILAAMLVSCVEIWQIDLREGVLVSVDDLFLLGFMSGWAIRLALRGLGPALREQPAIFVFIGAVLISCVFSISHTDSLVAGVKILGYVITALAIREFLADSRKQIILTLFGVIAITLSAIALQASGSIPHEAVNLSGGFFDWNYTAIALSLIILFLAREAYLQQDKGTLYATAIAFGFCILGILLTRSRSGTVVFGIMLLALGWNWLPQSIRKPLTKPIVIFISAGVLIVAGFFALVSGTIDNLLTGNDLQSRISSIFIMLECWIRTPLPGCGYGAWEAYVALYYPENAHHLQNRFGSAWLLLAETGIIGTISFYSIYAMLVKKKSETDSRTSLLGILVVLILASLLYSIHLHWFTWIVTGLILARAESTKTIDEDEPRQLK